MKRLLALFLFAAAVTTLSACDLFCTCEPPLDDHLALRVLNRQGENLLAGPQARFRLDSLAVLEQPFQFSVHAAAVQRSNVDSGQFFLFFHRPGANKAYLHYNRSSAPDTLDVRWEERKGRCCRESYTVQELREVKVNGSTTTPQNGVYTIIKP